MKSNLEAVTALDLILQPRFKGLLSLVKNNLNQASIRYPVGYEEGAIDIKEFLNLYENQKDNKVTYLVNIPISRFRYKQGQIRLVRENSCIENYGIFGHTIDFCESESPVVFFDHKDLMFDVIKKQHTLAQAAAVSHILKLEGKIEKELNVVARVVAFKSTVLEDEKIQAASVLFYKEVKGICSTKDWESLWHEVNFGEKKAIDAVNFYKSIPGYTWQPVGFQFPLVKNPRFCTTKVREMKKLIEYAINDDVLEDFRNIVSTIVNTVDWEKEMRSHNASKELSVYLLRGLFNFEKRLKPLLEDGMGGIGINFDMCEHLEDYFNDYPIKQYLGSTSIDKKPWQHLVKVANEVNKYLSKNDRLTSGSFFHVKNDQFVQIIYRLANPQKNSNVSMLDVTNYINVHCPLV